MNPSSKTAEDGWRLAARILSEEVAVRLKDKKNKSKNRLALEHVVQVVIPSITRRADIIKRNRRSYD